MTSSGYSVARRRSNEMVSPDGIFVGPRPHGFEPRYCDIQRGDRGATPPESQVRVAFSPLEIQDYFLQQGAEQFLAIAIDGGSGAPDLTNIGGEHLNTLELFWAERVRPLLLPAA
jgi:Reverse transcriptase (RNA-dependent DNA polymerase)